MAVNKTDNINEYHLNRNQPEKAQFVVYDMNQYLMKNQANTTRPHIHSYYQVIWFKSGTGKHFVDFKEYDVFENAIFFIAKNQVHYFDANTDYTGVLIHFNEIFLINNDSEMDFLLKFELFNNPYQQPSCCIGHGIEHTLDGYLQQIMAELQSPDPFGKEELLRIYLKAFLIQVQRRRYELQQTNGQFPIALDERRAQLMKFVNLVDENYMKGMSVAEYARSMLISSRTLSDLTSQLLNKTPSQMVMERTILEAQRLLLHSNLNVSQIGYRLGFDDPSYFVKYFKKHTSISPTDFRKSIAANREG
jgi:AraC family transcriptional regulator, transcriptional activator of pobA